MCTKQNVTIEIGPLSLCFQGDEALLSAWQEAEQWQPKGLSTARYEIRMDRVPALKPEGTLVHDYLGVQAYLDGGTESRYYYHSVDPDKRLFARSRQTDPHTISLSLLEDRSLSTQSLWSMVSIERLLLQQDALLLHSASVIYHGQAILFSAPSGTGKSTQANLWKKHTSATAFNGDRNLLWRRGGQWMVAGSPWHGTSPDCVNDCVPLRSIVVVRQAKTDAVRTLSPMEKTIDLSSEITVNRWNAQDVEQALDLVEDLVQNMDIVGLNCTMNPSAVSVLRQYLEETNGTV